MKTKLHSLLLIAGLATAAALLPGCATDHTKTVTTTAVVNGVTNTTTTVTHDQLLDAMAGKVVITESTLYGLKAKVLGNSYVSPFDVELGFGRTVYRTLPTSVTGTVSTAPYNATAHGNASIINQTADESVSTTTNLATYAPQAASVFNPVTGGFGSSPVVGTTSSGNPIIVSSNAAPAAVTPAAAVTPTK